jgi:hypothetical protein
VCAVSTTRKERVVLDRFCKGCEFYNPKSMSWDYRVCIYNCVRVPLSKEEKARNPEALKQFKQTVSKLGGWEKIKRNYIKIMSWRD